MASTLLIAYSSPTSVADVEGFSQWYTELHIPEVRAAIPSISKVTRWQLTDPATGDKLNRFAAVYEIEEADVAVAAAGLFSAAAGFTQTEFMDREIDPPVLHWVSKTGPDA
ncbi:MAG: hypothetical protein F2806_03190 [Actinobacteria bacterium]|uniref:Unannotated protein n=1 Tax=freshwater metagenome TaxID=449393 RepID=A0A6J7FMH2_9ZZZZ|nr:hypothetical protein [Actinomycetota bacterium]